METNAEIPYIMVVRYLSSPICYIADCGMTIRKLWYDYGYLRYQCVPDVFEHPGGGLRPHTGRGGEKQPSHYQWSYVDNVIHMAPRE